jgi:hypothetical protein
LVYESGFRYILGYGPGSGAHQDPVRNQDPNINPDSVKYTDPVKNQDLVNKSGSFYIMDPLMNPGPFTNQDQVSEC